MRSVIWMCGIVTLLATVGPARAELRFTRTTVDLGEVKGGAAAEAVFAFTNVGTEPLEIVEVRPGCGCLAPALTSLKFAPGEAGKLTLRLRTLGQADGPHAWHTQLKTRAGSATHDLTLTVAAAVRNEVTVQPAVAALYVENAQQMDITVTDRRQPGLRVTAVRSSEPALRVTSLPLGDGVTRLRLEVLARDLPLGRHEATVEILTDDPLYRHLQVPVTLTRGGRAAVSVAPEIVRVPAAEERPQTVQLVRLRPRGEEKVVVAAVEADDPAIVCTWAAGPDSGATLRVQVDARRLGQARAHAVRVRLTEPAGETVTIPVLVGSPE